jgi:hypothetical protein
VLADAVVFTDKAPEPTATLFAPVVFEAKAA